MARKPSRTAKDRNASGATPGTEPPATEADSSDSRITDASSKPTTREPNTTDDATTEDEVTRCVCGRLELVVPARSRHEADPGLFVQCERCHVWQHGFCVGFLTEDSVPDAYYCELCEPTFHELKNGGSASKYLGPSKRRRRGSEVVDVEVKPESEPATTTTNAPNGRKRGGRSPDTDKKPEVEAVEVVEKPEKPEKPEKKAEKRAETPRRRRNSESDAETHEPERDEPEQKPSEEAASDDEDKEPRPRRRREGSAERVLGDRASRARRRSREEDLILQRVLEESAREAMAQGLQPETESKHSSRRASPEEADEAENDEEERAPKRQRRNGRHESTEDEQPAPPTPSGRRRRKPALNGSSNDTNIPPSGRTRRSTRATNSAAPAKGRKCTPRIPSARITVPEMRRRVAAIIEFSTRTQNDLTEEARAREAAMESRRSLTSTANDELGMQLELLAKKGNENLELLEDLTRQLFSWQDDFGS